MQYSTFLDRKKVASSNSRIFKREYQKILLWGVKVVALFLMLYFIEQKVQDGHLSFGRLFSLSFSMFQKYSGYSLLIPLLLVLANWYLEARKWQFLAAPVVQLNMVQATRAVLTGLSFGFITPRSVGDYAGRILETPAIGRERLIGAVLLNRISQSFITFFFGIVGLYFIFSSAPGKNYFTYKWEGLLLFLLTLTSILFLGKGRFWLNSMAERYAAKPLVQLLTILKEYSQKDILRVVWMSFLRYVVFSLQFVLILWAAGVDLQLSLMAAGVAVVFLLKSLIPAFNFLSDLGVREFSALWAFSFFAVPEDQLITASLLVWCLNILLPTIAGGINILRLRLNRFRC